MKPDIRERKSMRVAFVRKTGPYSESAPAAWSALMAFAGPAGLTKGEFVAVCHDDPEQVAADALRYDACVSVGDGVTAGDGVELGAVAGGRFAVFVHKGPYASLSETYKPAYKEWIPAAGLRPATAPCLEVYLNCPQNTPPDELLTEIWIPVQ